MVECVKKELNIQKSEEQVLDEQVTAEREPDEQEADGKIQTQAQLEDFYSQGFRNCGAAYLRFILMAFVCFWNFGFPEPTGILSTISGFAIPCFFILSGYFILPDSKEIRTEKEKRKIRRTLFCLVFMFVLYLLINVLVGGIHTLADAATRRTIFNFVVLNLWPFSIGSNIWFIQAMLYAYIVILIAEKLNLMRFYKAILIITLICMLLSGEFAGLIHFNVLGYNFIPGNWFTRALPYILLGKLLREKEELLRISTWKYIMILVVGAVLSLAEIFILSLTGFLVYEGHMIGYGIMAIAACGLALSKPLGREVQITASVTQFDPVLSGIIYLLMDPLFYLIGLFIGSEHFGIFSIVGGLVAYAVSLLIAIVLKNTKVVKVFYS